MQVIFSYIDICTLAYQNKMHIEIKPEERKILLYENNTLLGQYLEIGNLIFTFIENK